MIVRENQARVVDDETSSSAFDPPVAETRIRDSEEPMQELVGVRVARPASDRVNLRANVHNHRHLPFGNPPERSGIDIANAQRCWQGRRDAAAHQTQLRGSKNEPYQGNADEDEYERSSAE